MTKWLHSVSSLCDPICLAATSTCKETSSRTSLPKIRMPGLMGLNG